MSEPSKPKVGLRERLQIKRRERQHKKAEAIDRARREGAMSPRDARRHIHPGSGGGDSGGGLGGV
jgi:hypothetical protein